MLLNTVKPLLFICAALLLGLVILYVGKCKEASSLEFRCVNYDKEVCRIESSLLEVEALREETFLSLESSREQYSLAKIQISSLSQQLHVFQEKLKESNSQLAEMKTELFAVKDDFSKNKVLVDKLSIDLSKSSDELAQKENLLKQANQKVLELEEALSQSLSHSTLDRGRSFRAKIIKIAKGGELLVFDYGYLRGASPMDILSMKIDDQKDVNLRLSEVRKDYSIALLESPTTLLEACREGDEALFFVK